MWVLHLGTEPRVYSEQVLILDNLLVAANECSREKNSAGLLISGVKTLVYTRKFFFVKKSNYTEVQRARKQ